MFINYQLCLLHVQVHVHECVHVQLLEFNSYRYTSHCNSEYKIDSCFTNDDAFVMSGSENGKIYCWDLVEVHMHT